MSTIKLHVPLSIFADDPRGRSFRAFQVYQTSHTVKSAAYYRLPQDSPLAEHDSSKPACSRQTHNKEHLRHAHYPQPHAIAPSLPPYHHSVPKPANPVLSTLSKPQSSVTEAIKKQITRPSSKPTPPSTFLLPLPQTHHPRPLTPKPHPYQVPHAHHNHPLRQQPFQAHPLATSASKNQAIALRFRFRILNPLHAIMRPKRERETKGNSTSFPRLRKKRVSVGVAQYQAALGVLIRFSVVSQAWSLGPGWEMGGRA